MSISITHTASAKGSGKLKGSDLTTIGQSIPPDATVDVITKKAVDQRDNDSWTIEAQWSQEVQDKWQPTNTLHYPPGVRSADDGQHRKPY